MFTVAAELTYCCSACNVEWGSPEEEPRPCWICGEPGVLGWDSAVPWAGTGRGIFVHTDGIEVGVL